MRRILGIFALTLALTPLLGACSGMKTHTEIEALNEAKPAGSPFTQRLAAEYKSYVKGRQRAMDYADARHFARKGLLAAQGKAVMPEPLSNWHLSESSAKDLNAGRTRLLQSLDAGGRAMAPFEAAVAQSKYDCWIEQAEQSWTNIIGQPSCRGEFESAMNALEDRMTKAVPKSDKLGEPVPPKQLPPEAPVQESAAPAPQAAPTGLDEGMFLVFFDFNKSTLNATGSQIIDAISEQAKTRENLNAVTIVGHADTSGSDKYNQRLSQRRAQTVKGALVKRGMDAKIMAVSGRGESEPMVKTPNNTREPANRRVQVGFE